MGPSGHIHPRTMVAEYLVGSFIILALASTILSLIAWRRSGNRKLLIVSAAMMLFLIQGILFAVEVLSEGGDLSSIGMVSLVLDTLILIGLLVAMVLPGRKG